jgi:hypothetical protein
MSLTSIVIPRSSRTSTPTLEHISSVQSTVPLTDSSLLMKSTLTSQGTQWVLLSIRSSTQGSELVATTPYRSLPHSNACHQALLIKTFQALSIFLKMKRLILTQTHSQQCPLKTRQRAASHQSTPSSLRQLCTIPAAVAQAEQKTFLPSY